MTARVPDGEQPVGGGRCECGCTLEAHVVGYSPWCPWHGCREFRPAEPTVDGLAELEALRAKVARVEALVAKWRVGRLPDQGRAFDLRRALDGD